MINDNVTEMLDLGPMPKRRGRPVTGAAMSPAEKQRQYRERLNRNVTDKDQRISSLEAQVELLKRQLAAVIEGNVTGNRK